MLILNLPSMKMFHWKNAGLVAQQKGTCWFFMYLPTCSKQIYHSCKQTAAIHGWYGWKIGLQSFSSPSFFWNFLLWGDYVLILWFHPPSPVLLKWFSCVYFTPLKTTGFSSPKTGQYPPISVITFSCTEKIIVRHIKHCHIEDFPNEHVYLCQKVQFFAVKTIRHMSSAESLNFGEQKIQISSCAPVQHPTASGRRWMKSVVASEVLTQFFRFPWHPNNLNI